MEQDKNGYDTVEKRSHDISGMCHVVCIIISHDHVEWLFYYVVWLFIFFKTYVYPWYKKVTKGVSI